MYPKTKLGWAQSQKVPYLILSFVCAQRVWHCDYTQVLTSPGPLSPDKKKHFTWLGFNFEVCVFSPLCLLMTVDIWSQRFDLKGPFCVGSNITHVTYAELNLLIWNVYWSQPLIFTTVWMMFILCLVSHRISNITELSEKEEVNRAPLYCGA